MAVTRRASWIAATSKASVMLLECFFAASSVVLVWHLQRLWQLPSNICSGLKKKLMKCPPAIKCSNWKSIIYKMIFPLKSPFREDFPASRVWWPEGTIKSRTSPQYVRWARCVCNLFVVQNSKMGLSENEVYPKIIQNHHFQAGLMMINHWIFWFSPKFSISSIMAGQTS